MLCVDMTATGLGVAAFCTASLPSVKKHPDQLLALAQLEAVVTSFFLTLYVLCLATARKRWAFARRWSSIFDLACFAPYFIGRIVVAAKGDLHPFQAPDAPGRSVIIRVLRLVRVFRLLGISVRASGNVAVVVNAMRESADMLLVMLFIDIIIMVIFSTMMYYAENHAGGNLHLGNVVNPAQTIPAFTSIPQTFWWCVVTMLTVGYGDMVPITPGGQLVAGLCMLTSFIVLALPISVVGANFTHQWLLHRDTQLLRRRTQRCGAEFASFKADFGVHAAMIGNVLAAASARGGSMAARAAQLRVLARRAGLKVVYEPAPGAAGQHDEDTTRRIHAAYGGLTTGGSFASLSGLEDAASPGSDEQPVNTPASVNRFAFRGLSSVEGASLPLPPLADRETVSRAELNTLEASMEELLAQLQEDAASVGETFAMAELVSSDDFSAKCDEVLAKHDRLGTAVSSASDAVDRVTALLRSLARERAQRPGLLQIVDDAHIPGVGDAALAATAALVSHSRSFTTVLRAAKKSSNGHRPETTVDNPLRAAPSPVRGGSVRGGVDPLAGGVARISGVRRIQSIEELEFKRLQEEAAKEARVSTTHLNYSPADAQPPSPVKKGGERQGSQQQLTPSERVAQALAALTHLTRLRLGTPMQAGKNEAERTDTDNGL